MAASCHDHPQYGRRPSRSRQDPPPRHAAVLRLRRTGFGRRMEDVSSASRERFATVVRAGGAAGDPDDVRLDLALLLISAETLPDDDSDEASLEALLTHGTGRLDELADAVPADGRDDARVREVAPGR